MMYFELKHPWVRRSANRVHPPGYYYHTGMMGTSIVSSQSSRIWEEGAGDVWYVKTDSFPEKPVDIKEFAWIKLQAKPLEDYR